MRRPTHKPPSISTLLNVRIVTAKMDFLRAESLNCISLLEDISGVNSDAEYIISVRSDIIAASLAPPNPDIWVKTGWLQNHFPQGMQ